MPSEPMKHENEQPVVTLHPGASTDVGSVRSENQDAFGTFPADGKETDNLLFVVADGMGGHARGREASQTAVEVIGEVYYQEKGSPTGRLEKAFSAANAEIHQLALQNPDHEKTGTTCTALAYSEGHLWIAHVGDSRAYRISEEDIEQLTRDHTWAEVMRRRQVLTDEEAATHPRRNVLVQALGIKETVQVDLLDLGPPVPQQWFLLCSDGLSEVPSDKLQSIVTTHIPQKASEKLLEEAINRDSRDNVTAMIIAIF